MERTNGRFGAVVLFGPPGSGKRTQGIMLGRLPGFEYLSTGDVLSSLDPAQRLGQLINSYIERGTLVPVVAAMTMFREELAARRRRGLDPSKHCLVLDGLPRTHEQAVRMAALVRTGAVIHFQCEDEALLTRRITGGRAPERDEEQRLRRRFDVYNAHTRPVLDFYDSGIVRSIDATASTTDVTRQILIALGRRSPDRRAQSDVAGIPMRGSP